MITYPTTTPATLTTSIIGIGGAGSNVLRCLPAPTKQDLQLFCTALDDRLANTNEHAHFVQLGTQQYHGMGTGGDPMLGLRAAQECSPALEAMINERDLVVLVAGLGGGTGSGVTPYLAQKAKDAGCFLVSVVVMPFAFEGPRRREQAEQALAQLSQLSDLVFCFENDYMEALLESHTSARSLFGESDQILSQAAACVPMIATKPGMIHLGLDDLQNALTNENARCLFGIGRASGETRAIDAAIAALQSPLMNKKFLTALGDKMLVHIAGDESMKLSEIREVIETLRHQLQTPDLEIIFGTSTKTNWNDTLRVTLISAINAETMRASMAEEITEEKDLEIELVAIPEPELEPEPEPQPEPAPEPEPEPSFDLQDEAFSLSDPMPSPKVKIKKEKKPIERPEYLFGDGLSSLSKISTTSSETKVEEAAPVPPMFEGILPPTGEAEAPTPTEPLAPMDEGMATPEEEEDYSDNDLDTPPSLRSSGIAPWMKRD